MGIDRFGVQTLVWVIIGYFSLFDLGLGRTLTKLVADKLALGHPDEIPELFWTALALMTSFGLISGVLIAISANWLVTSFLKIPSMLVTETIQTLWLLALAIPIVVLTSALRGTMEAQQRFFGISVLRFLLGAFMYVAPVVTLIFTPNLAVITATLLAGRLLFTGAHFVLCARSLPGLMSEISVTRRSVRPLLSMGAWITVSNVISPIMANLDRFFIGAILSIAAVAYYATPFEMVMKLVLIPTALAGVLFPAFAAGFATNRKRTAGLFLRGGKYIFIALFPITIITVAYAPEVLELWLGRDFAANSTRVMQWLVVGIFINGLAQIPFSLLQGIGRADITAKLHLVEVPIYLAMFFSLTHYMGIEGAAIAWTARVAFDALVLFVVSAKPLGFSKRRQALTIAAATLGIAIPLFFFITLGPCAKATLVFLTMAGFVAAIWSHILDDEERDWIRGQVRGRRQ